MYSPILTNPSVPSCSGAKTASAAPSMERQTPGGPPGERGHSSPSFQVSSSSNYGTTLAHASKITGVGPSSLISRLRPGGGTGSGSGNLCCHPAPLLGLIYLLPGLFTPPPSLCSALPTPPLVHGEPTCSGGNGACLQLVPAVNW